MMMTGATKTTTLRDPYTRMPSTIMDRFLGLLCRILNLGDKALFVRRSTLQNSPPSERDSRSASHHDIWRHAFPHAHVNLLYPPGKEKI